MTAILELRGATKAFGGNAAFKGVDFTLESGEVHALLGENGAGKSTLTKVLAGLYRLTSGEMLQDGKPASFASPADALHCGVAMVFQETNLVPSMTVAQNIYLGDERFFNRLRGVYIEAQQFLQGLNFHVDPTALVSTLGAAKKQMVEIARAVHHKARVIIFDEPTATLTPEEKLHFFTFGAATPARRPFDRLHHACARGSARRGGSHHHPARRRAGRHRRRLGVRQGAYHPGHGRALPLRRTLRRRRPKDARAGHAGAERRERQHGERREEHLVLRVRRAGDRHLRPRWRGAGPR